MLIGQSTWSAGDRAMDTVIVLDRAFRAQLVRRHRLLFDTRFAAALGVADAQQVTLFLVLEGFVQLEGAARHAEPAIWVLRDDELEHVAPGSRTFRSWGAPATVLTMRLSAHLVRGAVGLAAGPRPLPAPAAAALRALGGVDDTHGKEAPFRALVAALIASGHVEEQLARELTDEEPAHLERVWAALASVYERQDTAAYVDLIAGLAHVSPRQVQRDLRDLAQRAGFDGFRATMRGLRLRRAVGLLSAPELEVSEVARIVGYGSADAMGRAFRDAGLPAPSVVRDEVRYPDSPPPND